MTIAEKPASKADSFGQERIRPDSGGAKFIVLFGADTDAVCIISCVARVMRMRENCFNESRNLTLSNVAR